MHRVGLHFRRSDARRLKEIARHCRTVGQPSHLYAKAATAASHNDQLIVICDGKDDATMIADGFTLYGIERPSITLLPE